MDAIIINKAPQFKPSFPLFDLNLLSNSNFEPNLSDLVPIEQICGIVQRKLQKDIDLDDEFDLFSENKKVIRSSEKTGVSEKIGKNKEKRFKSSISMQIKVLNNSLSFLNY